MSVIPAAAFFIFCLCLDFSLVGFCTEYLLIGLRTLRCGFLQAVSTLRSVTVGHWVIRESEGGPSFASMGLSSSFHHSSSSSSSSKSVRKGSGAVPSEDSLSREELARSLLDDAVDDGIVESKNYVGMDVRNVYTKAILWYGELCNYLLRLFSSVFVYYRKLGRKISRF